MIDTPTLAAFMAVAESGSFSGAAERLYITQPAISKRIGLLEEKLEARLFDRIGRQIQLTEAGRALLPRARQVLMDVNDMSRAIHDLSGSVTGKLRIGTSHHIGLHRLPPVLRQFSRDYPQVKLDIHFIDSEAAWEGVLHGELEMGVVTLPPQPDDRLFSETIWHDPLVFMCAPEHPLACLESVTLERLTAHSAILPSPVTFTRGIVERLFDQHNLKLDIAMSTNYLETIHMMVSIGLGWSVLPATMVDHSMVQLPVNAPLPQRELGVVVHPARSQSNAAQAFLKALHQHRD